MGFELFSEYEHSLLHLSIFARVDVRARAYVINRPIQKKLSLIWESTWYSMSNKTILIVCNWTDFFNDFRVWRIQQEIILPFVEKLLMAIKCDY